MKMIEFNGRVYYLHSSVYNIHKKQLSFELEQNELSEKLLQLCDVCIEIYTNSFIKCTISVEAIMNRFVKSL